VPLFIQPTKTAKSIVTTRAEIRKQIRLRRQQLSLADQLHASQAISNNLANSQLFRNSRRIAGFLSNDNEPDLTPLMQLAWQQKKQWHLPIIGLPNINQLWFAAYKKNDPLVVNRFGIGEPDTPLHETTRSFGLDLVLMPLVAFDLGGNRLGMGKGYYDRTLKFLRLRRHWHKPRLVGIAYEFQKYEQLPQQPWDIPLDAIVTEKSVYNIRQLNI
jgi:5-formyltetrahydrofolate cyclo-ligase